MTGILRQYSLCQRPCVTNVKILFVMHRYHQDVINICGDGGADGEDEKLAAGKGVGVSVF
ncbi:hypothetical protein HMPREF1250_0894 [Megasphaera vaginalis (ex Srinivasan et al. 2021)]|uniref:Uncharacterized protein n=1 Tax=Megasphaera vaginalis (ex Srinivasan et al. 2021) TaxID=1111454 RepID=U7UL20_9FIRM|nr:hypothetical protein HMPREF1250_0894 [Megasphaera vaginalis (ex Srinivasan et al. 2021)]